MAHLDPEAGTWTGTDAPHGIPPGTLQKIKDYRDAIVSVDGTLASLPPLYGWDHKFPSTAWDHLEKVMAELAQAHKILSQTLADAEAAEAAAKADAAQKKPTRKSRAKPKTASPEAD